MIFVKLRQFAPGDTARVVVPPRRGHFEGLRRTHLHRFGVEEVAIFETKAPSDWTLEAAAPGLEVLTLAGEHDLEGQRLSRWDWVRAPGRSLSIRMNGPGAIWVKMGHLPLLLDGRGEGT